MARSHMNMPIICARSFCGVNEVPDFTNCKRVKTLSSTLGHYSAGFTLSTYTHATPDMMREAADTMGDVIGKAI